jgi:hypothetical protein
MKSSIGTLALRFAATVVLFAPTVTAQAQGIGQTICRNVWVPPPFIGFEEGHTERVCNSVYYPPPPPPPPEPPVTHTIGTETTVHYDAAAEARKAQLRATEHRVPPSSNLCPPPYRITASDGCQK